MEKLISWIEGRAKFCLFLILVVALFLRIYHISVSSLWFDELITFNYSNWAALFQNTEQSLKQLTHPLGYHLIMSLWILLFGKSEFVFRMFSTLADLASIAMLYSIAMCMDWKRSVALAVCATYAVAFTPIYYAQEARPYALMIFLALLLLHQSLQTHKLSRLNLFSMLPTALALTQIHFFGILGVAGVLVTGILSQTLSKEKVISSIAVLGLCLLSLLPLFPYMIEHVHKGQYWIIPANDLQFKNYFFDFIFGPEKYDWAFRAFFATTAIAIIFGQKLRLAWICGLLIWLFSGIFFCALYQYFFSPILVYRYLILGVPAVFLLLGSLFQSLAIKKPKLFVSVASMCIGAFAWGTYSSASFHHPQKSSLREAFIGIENYELEIQNKLPIYACASMPAFLNYYAEPILGRKIQVSRVCTLEDLAAIPARPILLIWYHDPMDYRISLSDILIERKVLFENLDSKVLLLDRCCH